MVSRPRLGQQQKKVLEILTANPHFTVVQVAERIYGKPIMYRTKQYNSICRSFHLLENAGLVEREGGGAIKWHVSARGRVNIQ